MIYRWKLSTESTLVSGSQTAANWACLSLQDLQDVFYELWGGSKSELSCWKNASNRTRYKEVDR